MNVHENGEPGPDERKKIKNDYEKFVSFDTSLGTMKYFLKSHIWIPVEYAF